MIQTLEGFSWGWWFSVDEAVITVVVGSVAYANTVRLSKSIALAEKLEKKDIEQLWW